MTLELIASRVLSPYFGNSNIVWTSVIGIILLSSSVGNYMGGKIADKNECEKSLKYIVLEASFFIFLIPIIQTRFLNIVATIIKDVKIGAIISTIALFFIPSAFLGTIIPIVLKIKLNKIENAGKTSGTVYALSTIGGIFGTFVSGFLLIPNFGSVQILFVLSIILSIISFFISTNKKKLMNIIIAGIITMNVVLLAIYSNNNLKSGEQVLNGEENTKVSLDTQYGRVMIYNSEYNGEEIRIMNIDSGFESATYIDEEKCNELVSTYTKYYDLMFKSKYDVDDVLMIGGAGYSYPKYFISHYEDKRMDVVEIDGEITEIAKKYFFLDKLIDDYKLNENKRLNLINEDGRTYLNKNKKKYDAILNDAFSGENPAKTLTTLENIKQTKEALTENGLYLSNVVSAMEGKDSRFIRAEVNTLKRVFKNVYVIPCNPEVSAETKQNIMVISTD